ISDLGASFGTAGADWPLSKSKGNLESYARSKFVVRTTAEYVDFKEPAWAGFKWFVRPGDYFTRLKLRWIGRHIPRSDARWMGDLLGQLSEAQIRDAFRAAGYSRAEIDGFTDVVERRISALREL